MTRILGFVLGVGVVGAGSLLWLHPAGLSPQPETAAPPPRAAVAQGADQAVVVETDVGEPAAVPLSSEAPSRPDPVADRAEAATEQPADQTSAPGPDGGDRVLLPPASEGPPPGSEPGPDGEVLPGGAPGEPAPPAEEAPTQGGRHLFWAPFRSQVAARGFAARLSADTEVAVEVVTVGPGRYRVGFDYQDETERRALVNRIQVITGLELE